jgi:hypothetical protein
MCRLSRRHYTSSYAYATDVKPLRGRMVMGCRVFIFSCAAEYYLPLRVRRCTRRCTRRCACNGINLKGCFNLLTYCPNT